ncbi:Cytochrome c-type biogenesis protein CcdA (DsbD analog) [Hyphomicrobiales bacterium]|nr:Cytochrome c-type biogenesis protein CcdA (DsbD analog) [Hyphomicrobiales bacterium]CAH1667388.1 Cytochrome c-type biogenesis protein CcdA (DsbD analog) [Hyphomicrobiales bacterium]
MWRYVPFRRHKATARTAGMTHVSFSAAALAGLLSFLSPCVLPLVPPYLTYLAGTTIDELGTRATPKVNRRVIATALLFVLGFSTVFVLLGATASALGQVFRQYVHILGTLAGVAIIIMGLHFLGVFRLAFLYREARVTVRKPAGLGGAYVMGLAFALGWTPCIGPILAAILAVAGSEDSAGQGALLLAIYSAGLGIPFLIAAFAMPPFIAFLKRMRTRLALIEKAMGALLVLTGIAFLTGSITNMSFWLLETFPALGQLG